jgi:hypothetical protein
MSTTEIPAPGQPTRPAATVEQYKACLQDLGNIGTRYSTSNGFYLSVITALLGILSLMKRGEGLSDLQTILRLAVPAFAIGLCFVWRQTVFFYRAIFKAKFDVLREIEADGHLFPAYKREQELFTGPRWLLDNEARIPLYLALPFAIILCHTLYTLATKGA